MLGCQAKKSQPHRSVAYLRFRCFANLRGLMNLWRSVHKYSVSATRYERGRALPKPESSRQKLEEDARPPATDLLFVGKIFCDLVFTDVPIPAQGTESYSSGFAFSPGGVANRAVAAARLGARVRLLSQIGDDPLGLAIWKVLGDEPNLDLTEVRVLPDWQTPVTVAVADRRDRRFITYETPPPVRHGGPAPEPRPIKAIGLGVDSEPSAWLDSFRNSATTVVGTVGWDPTAEWSTDLMARLALLDVFVANDMEAIHYTRADSVLGAAKKLAERVPLAIVTQGGQGLTAIDSGLGKVYEVSAPRVDIIDPTGAGDVFIASYMFSLLQDWDTAERLRFAVTCASISVTGRGGALSAPTLKSVQSFVAANGTRNDWSFAGS